jgi:excisionase family DNA binding protein
MRFMTTGHVAAVCQVTIPTVKRWIREGHLVAFQTAGGHYRITEEELERFRSAWKMPVPGPASDGPPKILVIDDDPLIVSMLDDFLTTDGRYKVEVAQDGYEGLIKVGSFRPDLVILDIRMPGLDGFQVCQRVKTNPGSRATRILVMTGHAEGDTAARIVKAGADVFLEKPVRLTRLQAELDRLLGASSDRHQVVAHRWT